MTDCHGQPALQAETSAADDDPTNQVGSEETEMGTEVRAEWERRVQQGTATKGVVPHEEDEETGIRIESHADWERRVKQGTAPQEEAPGGRYYRSDTIEGSPLVQKDAGSEPTFISFDALGYIPPALKKQRDAMRAAEKLARQANSTRAGTHDKHQQEHQANYHNKTCTPLLPLRAGFLKSTAGMGTSCTDSLLARAPSVGGCGGGAVDGGRDSQEADLMKMLENAHTQLDTFVDSCLVPTDELNGLPACIVSLCMGGCVRVGEGVYLCASGRAFVCACVRACVCACVCARACAYVSVSVCICVQERESVSVCR